MSTAAPDPRSAHAEPETPSLGTLLSDITRDFSTLFRQEVALAKAELTDTGKKAGKGIGFLVGAALAGFFVLLFLSIAIWWGLGFFLNNFVSAIVVLLIWAIVAAILAVMGRNELRRIRGIPQTTETIKEIPPTLKPGGTA